MKESLTLFTCKVVGDKLLLYASVDIDCNSSSHVQWQVAAAATLFVFIVLLPLLVFWRMWCVREAIENEDHPDHVAAQRQWGFLVNNLEGRFFYWELVKQLSPSPRQ